MIIGLLFFCIPIFAKDIPEPIKGTIKVKKISHQHYKQGKYEEGKTRVTNKQNRPDDIYYFDPSGNLTEQIGYGKHHNADLRILDNVLIFRYKGNNIIRQTRYDTDYQRNIDTTFKWVYTYNDQGRLIRKDKIDCGKDEITDSTEYVYSDTGTTVIEYLSSTYFYRTTYDRNSHIVRHQQILDSKLRWERTYTYTDSTRIGIFLTYYDSSKNSYEREISEYKNGQIIKIVDYGIGSKMTEFYYDKRGLLRKVELSSNYSDVYELTHRIFFKTRNAKHLDELAIRKINKTLLENYTRL